MNEQHITVAKTARYYTSGPITAAVREVWFVCHGYAQLARFFARAFTPLANDERVIVAPEALNRYYYETEPGVHAGDARVSATWMTKEDRESEIADYVAYLDTLHAHLLAGREDVTVLALGFSQGAATVSRWAAHGSAKIDHVVLWGSSLPPEIAAVDGALRGATITLAIGARDPFMTEARLAREIARFDKGGLEYQLLHYDAGHAMDAAALRKLVRVMISK